LYPASFREEYEAELRAVFAIAITEAGQINLRNSLIIILRELRDFPFSLLREHWHSLTQLESNLMGIINKPDWTFYLPWIFLTALCVPIAFVTNAVIFLPVLTIIFGDFIYVDGVRHITEDYLGFFTFVPLVGLLTGVLQYGLLRRYLPRMGWWVLATFGGWLLGLLLILMYGWFNSWTYESFDMDFVFIVLGLSIGGGQWLVLRHRLSKAGWWIGANVLGWVLSDLIIGEGSDQGEIFALGVLPACVTAAMLAWLLNQAQPSETCGI
jgi:hypothetical protein